jgi:hypothetical protein
MSVPRARDGAGPCGEGWRSGDVAPMLAEDAAAGEAGVIGRQGARAVSVWSIVGMLGAALIAAAGALAWTGGLAPAALPRGDISLERWDQGIVTASGNWVDPATSDVLKTSEILCRLDAGYCVEGQGSIGLGNVHAKAGMGQITRWDKDMILFLDDEPCVSFNYKITRNPAAVTLARRTKVNRIGCESVEKQDATLTLGTDPVGPAGPAGSGRGALTLGVTAAALAGWILFVLWGLLRGARA